MEERTLEISAESSPSLSSYNDDDELQSHCEDKNDTCKVGKDEHVLPPCKVCRTQATGFHYGINSCEACKGFFRRSILRKKEYRCSKNTKCLLLPGKHKLCPYCRFKRCLAVGMSVDGIKTGRYTYEKRTRDILEMKMMTQAELAEDDSVKDKTKHLMDLAQEVRIQADKLLEEMQAVRKSRDVEQKQRQFLVDPNSMLNALGGECLHKAGKYMSTSERAFNSGSTAEPEETIQKIHFPSEPNHNYAINREQWYERSNQRDIKQSNSCQSSSEVDSASDNNRDVKLAWFRTIEFGIRCLVRFIKAIPGFRNLHIDDQLNLIKHSFLEAWLVSRHKAFNTEKQVYTAANGFTLDVGLTVSREMFSIVLRSVGRLQALNLNSEETYILQAIVQLFPDRCEMKNYSQVENLQKHYLEILCCLLKVNHKDDKLILPRILAILTELRNFTDIFYKTSSQTNGNLPLIKDSAPLLMEMVTSVQD